MYLSSAVSQQWNEEEKGDGSLRNNEWLCTRGLLSPLSDGSNSKIAN